MKKIVSACIFILLLFGCNDSNNENVIRLYYFKSIMTTPIQVNCNTIYGYYGIRKIEIDEDEEFLSLKKVISSLKVSEFQDDIDVRYKVIYLKDTLCLDTFGGVIYNGTKMNDSPETLEYLKDLIRKYKHKAIKREDEFEIPDLESN
jgi:hypothetical protein